MSGKIDPAGIESFVALRDRIKSQFQWDVNTQEEVLIR